MEDVVLQLGRYRRVRRCGDKNLRKSCKNSAHSREIKKPHTNDWDCASVYAQSAANHVRIRIQAYSPEPLRDHYRGRSTEVLALRIEKSAEHRLHAQCGEVVRWHEPAAH